MRSRFSGAQTFLLAAGVGLAVAVAPLAVDAAKRTARAIAVDKKGRAKVVVSNKPSVKLRGAPGVTVPGGVAVTNEPNVRVPEGVAVTNRPNVDIGNEPTVTVGNQPTVTVSNQPTEMSVSAGPGRLTATVRPPLDDVFNYMVTDVAGLEPNEIIELSGPRSAAITHVSATVRKFGNPVDAPTIVNVIRYLRTSGSNPCGATGWAPTVLRRFSLGTGETFWADFAAAPLVVKPDAQGRPVCVVLKLYQWVGDTRVDMAADGYTF